MLSLLVAVASAHDFSSLPTAVPALPEVPAGDAEQALRLMMLPFMQEPGRFASLERLGKQARSKRIDAVFQRCDAALKDGIRPGEQGFEGAAGRQEKGLVLDCIDAAHALARKLGVDGHKGSAASRVSPGASQPRFGVSTCPAVLASMGTTVPAPLTPRPLAKRGSHSAFGSAVVHVDGAGNATVMGRLYGDEAASRACWASADGPWRAPTDGNGTPSVNCFHLRCAW